MFLIAREMKVLGLKKPIETEILSERNAIWGPLNCYSNNVFWVSNTRTEQKSTGKFSTVQKDVVMERCRLREFIRTHVTKYLFVLGTRYVASYHTHKVILYFLNIDFLAHPDSIQELLIGCLHSATLLL